MSALGFGGRGDDSRAEALPHAYIFKKAVEWTCHRSILRAPTERQDTAKEGRNAPAKGLLKGKHLAIERCAAFTVYCYENTCVQLTLSVYSAGKTIRNQTSKKGWLG